MWKKLFKSIPEHFGMWNFYCIQKIHFVETWNKNVQFVPRQKIHNIFKFDSLSIFKDKLQSWCHFRKGQNHLNFRSQSIQFHHKHFCILWVVNCDRMKFRMPMVDLWLFVVIEAITWMFWDMTKFCRLKNLIRLLKTFHLKRILFHLKVFIIFSLELNTWGLTIYHYSHRANWTLITLFTLFP